MPGCARNTRAMCSACAPEILAVASSQCSAIQRRRVILTFSSSSLEFSSDVSENDDRLGICKPGAHRISERPDRELRPETPGGRLMRPPECCLFGCFVRYF